MMEEFTWPIIMVIIAFLIIIVGIFVILRARRESKSGFPRSDERTSKINQKAAYYSMYIGLFFMISILFSIIIGKEFFNFPDLNAMPALNATVIVMSISFLLFRWYFNRKGES